MDLKTCIRDIADFPRTGVVFRDITPLLGNPEAFRQAVDAFLQRYESRGITKVVGIEARGFFFAAPLAYRLSKPLVPIRKQGKLPGRTRAISYGLEYGTGVVEMHADAIASGDRVLIIDDLLATGGTLAAAAELIEEAGGVVEELAVLVELTDLAGRDTLAEYEVFSLLRY
ncbi:MAG: adenine phosphoribosyltransferase [SAR202 cluster bacterium]|nr:adenine phosphoribosyltransferase [SAR202 cluster bacterium]